MGVDMESGLLCAVTTMPANASDVMKVKKLLHGKQQSLYARGYQCTWKHVRRWLTRRWLIGVKRGRIRVMQEGGLKNAVKTPDR